MCIRIFLVFFIHNPSRTMQENDLKNEIKSKGNDEKIQLQVTNDSKLAHEKASILLWRPAEGYSGLENACKAENASDLSQTACTDIEEEEEGVGTSSDSSQLTKEDVTYFNLLKNNRPFRLYMLSYLTSQIGEWLTYVAIIELTEQIIGPESQTSRTYISFLVVVRLFPILVLSPFGGMVADAYDRRKSMIILDLMAAILPLLFMCASYFQSIFIIYIVLLLQGIVAALYEPCRSAILPLMVPDQEMQKKATTLTGLAWSSMGALGSGLGGYMVAIVGVQGCFVIDAVTFLISAQVMWGVEGNWSVANASLRNMSPWDKAKRMINDGVTYITGVNFWPLIFLKFSAAFVYGGSDVLNVSFSEQDSGPGDEARNSERLGFLFCSVGVGCFIGPLICDHFTNMDSYKSILSACVVAFFFMGSGCFGMAYFTSFGLTALFTSVRAAGSSIQWIYSSLLLQILSDPPMLGRVLSVDYGLALASESLSAVLAGVLQDNYGLNANQVSAIFAIVGFMVFGIWLLYRIHLSTSTKLQIEWEESLASLPALGDIGEREIMNKTTEKNNKI